MNKPKCATCNRDAERMNSAISECSHIECPSRKQPTAAPGDSVRHLSFDRLTSTDDRLRKLGSE